MEFLLCFLLGMGLGIFAGLLPGIHVNNLTPLIPLLILSLHFPPLAGAMVVVTMAVVQTFISYLPSTFLGVPEEGTALSVLPSHRMVLEGKGYLSLKITTTGCLWGLFMGVLFALLLAEIFGRIYALLNPLIGWILLAVILLMILSEGSLYRMLWSLLIFLLSGALGLLTLDLGGKVLMPLLTGLFGTSVMLESLASRKKLPEQKVEGEFRPSLPPLLSGVGAGIFTGFLPGIGPAEGTVLSQLLTRSKRVEDFLFSVSVVNMVKVLFSFVALYAIGKPRSGAAIAVGELLEMGRGELLSLLGVALLAGALSTLLVLPLGRLVFSKISKVPYRILCLSIFFFILFLTLFLCGPIGLPLLFTATAIGLLPGRVGVRRSHGMGVILLPCTLYFLGLRSL
ncbi:MAG: tripartite tricarboxylate transporter permease [Candidatus Hadarchaeales archaeon]